MKITPEQYRKIADFLRAYAPEVDGTAAWGTYYRKDGIFHGPVVPKGRPRTGKGGNVYTPPETRKFETAVAKWAKEEGFHPVFFPVRVRLTIHDKTDDPTLRLHSIAGVTFRQTGGDLDNYGKAIMDGLNKIAWQDDKQIVHQTIGRRWSAAEGFQLTVERAGLSKNEYEQLQKFL